MSSSESAVVGDPLQHMVTLDGERFAELAPSTPVQANGGVVAALIAAGAACALLGVLTVITEADLGGLKELMTFSEPVGPLSGKTTVPTVFWLVMWPVLHARLRERELKLQRGCMATLALVAIGLLGTFPPFYQLFAVGG